MTALVDFHCHLDLYPDYEKVIAESEAAKVYTLAVTTTPRAWKRNRELTRDLQYVRPALGLHPQLVGKDTDAELELWDSLLPQTRYVGEIGIDGGTSYVHTLEQQQRVFIHILNECAKKGDKILSIHAAHSTKLVLDLLEAHFPPDQGTAVLHWFSGTLAQAQRAVELGCYFSINTAMIKTKSGQAIIRSLPKDRMLVETDGPFIEIDGIIARPKDIAYTVERLAKLLEMPVEGMRGIIMNNLKIVISAKD